MLQRHSKDEQTEDEPGSQTHRSQVLRTSPQPPPWSASLRDGLTHPASQPGRFRGGGHAHTPRLGLARVKLAAARRGCPELLV